MQLQGMIEDIMAVFIRIQKILPKIQVIVMDPAFPQVITRVRTLYDGLPVTPTKSEGGVAYQSKLASLIKPLDLAIQVQRDPWKLYAAIGGAIALIGVIGYRMGQRSAAAR